MAAFRLVTATPRPSASVTASEARGPSVSLKRYFAPAALGQTKISDRAEIVVLHRSVPAPGGDQAQEE